MLSIHTSTIPIENQKVDNFKPKDTATTFCSKKLQQSSLSSQIRNAVKLKVSKIAQKSGVFTSNHLLSAGFKYTGDGDTAECEACKLKISNWTQDMNPYNMHAEQRPDCPFILKLKTVSSANMLSTSPSLTTAIFDSTIKTEIENPSKRQKIETKNFEPLNNNLVETILIMQIRRRTFSHWPHRTIPSTAQMIEAGFFNCNVGDRVICIYCNLICQQWIPNIDDPSEVHKVLSPNCIYVKTILLKPATASIMIVNESVTSGNISPGSNNLDPIRSHEIVFTAACNTNYIEIPKRHASFTTWPKDNLPSVDDLVRAGFFYSGTKTIVTCFYCNGSLQNWGPNDNPMIEHARWFPHCAYAKQLCGDDLYRKIQESKRAQQERVRLNEIREKGGSSEGNSNPQRNAKQLLIPDESTLSRLVAARLDLPISQRLLDKNFKLSIIKRCWEDQLRLKHDDFVCESDLYIACLILQKQIEHIDGKKENIVIPNIKMKQIRQQNERLHEQSTNANQLASNNTDIEMTTSSQSLTNESTSSQSSVDSVTKSDNQTETKVKTQTNTNVKIQDQTTDQVSNPCVLCMTEEKRLACIPCGHLATCVACGHSLRSCPVCRREIEAFVRIYI